MLCAAATLVLVLVLVLVTAPRCVMIIMWLADPVASRRPLPPFWVRVFAPWVCEEQFLGNTKTSTSSSRSAVPYRVAKIQRAVCDCVVVCETCVRVVITTKSALLRCELRPCNSLGWSRFTICKIPVHVHEFTCCA